MASTQRRCPIFKVWILLNCRLWRRILLLLLGLTPHHQSLPFISQSLVSLWVVVFYWVACSLLVSRSWKRKNLRDGLLTEKRPNESDFDRRSRMKASRRTALPSTSCCLRAQRFVALSFPIPPYLWMAPPLLGESCHEVVLTMGWVGSCRSRVAARSRVTKHR